MHIEARSRMEFGSNSEYQLYCSKLFKAHGIDDGHGYCVSVDTGGVVRGSKLKVETDKISKSPSEADADSNAQVELCSRNSKG